jgi:hypothetical protein
MLETARILTLLAIVSAFSGECPDPSQLSFSDPDLCSVLDR